MLTEVAAAVTEPLAFVMPCKQREANKKQISSESQIWWSQLSFDTYLREHSHGGLPQALEREDTAPHRHVLRHFM